MLGLYRGIYWGYIGYILGLYRGIYWGYIGYILGLYGVKRVPA